MWATLYICTVNYPVCTCVQAGWSIIGLAVFQWLGIQAVYFILRLQDSCGECVLEI